MPIYEYRCNRCNRRFSHLHGVVADAPALECPRCHGTDLKRLISRVSRVRSEEERLDALDPSEFGDLDDPANMRRWAKAMGDEMGEDLDEDFEEAFEEMMEEEEKGEPGEEAAPADADAGEGPPAAEKDDT